MEKKYAKELIEFIDNSMSAFHAIYEIKKMLNEKGFIELKLNRPWDLVRGGKYYTTKNNSALVAFTIGSDLKENGFKIIGGHTDAPGFRIKPAPEMVVDSKYLKLNTEVYGGTILNTWMDRPLSIAGRVTIKGDNPFAPKEKLVNLRKPLLIIPNLAIHMNREVNDGLKLNPQEHTLPLLSMVNDKFEKDGFLIKLLAEELDVKEDEILDFELYLYPIEKGILVGLNEEFISSGKLDDLAMTYAIMRSISEVDSNSYNIGIAFDNEEVGSLTKQGAGSPFVKNVLKRIAFNEKLTEEEFMIAIENSFLISADEAHAEHPNFPSKSDPTNRPIINNGPAIKIAANQAYTTDAVSASIYKEICNKADVPYQIFVNRSDTRGGSTIGPISASQIEIRSVDIGCPILAMHSVREFGGVFDHFYVYKSFKTYYSL